MNVTRETRKITVERENPVYQEWDREVAIQIWHNPNQVIGLRLSPAEAASLRDKLIEYLDGGQ